MLSSMHTDGCLFYLTAHLLPTLIHLHLTPKEFIKDSFGLTLTSSYYLRWPVKNAKIQPKINGNKMLEELTNNDWLAVPFNFSMSNSMPTMNINKSNPIWLNCCNVPIDSFGKTKPKVVGNKAPTNEGPSTMPAIISPITAG